MPGAWTDEAKAFLGDYAHLPVLGQFYGSGDLNLEEIARLDPQVIIDLGEAKASIVEDMDAIQTQIGIPTVHIDARLSGYGDAYRMLGELLQLPDRADALADYCDSVYADTQAIMAAVGENRIRVLYCMGTNGTNVIAKGSFHAELLDLLADNVAVLDNPSSKGTGNEVSIEQILLWDPDVIIFAQGSIYDSVKTDPLWQELTAVASGRYVQAPVGPYPWMGFPSAVQRILGMLWLCDVLYPDYCQDDLYTQVSEYFTLFYHWELTKEQFDTLMADRADRHAVTANTLLIQPSRAVGKKCNFTADSFQKTIHEKIRS